MANCVYYGVIIPFGIFPLLLQQTTAGQACL